MEVLKLGPSIPKKTHTTSQNKPTNTVASWYQNSMKSPTLSPANPTVCVASQELCSHWHINHKTSLKCCPLGSHPPQAAQVKYFKNGSAFSQQNHLWLVRCKVNKIPFLVFFFLEVFSVFCRNTPYLLKVCIRNAKKTHIQIYIQIGNSFRWFPKWQVFKPLKQFVSKPG